MYSVLYFANKGDMGVQTDTGQANGQTDNSNSTKDLIFLFNNFFTILPAA